MRKKLFWRGRWDNPEVSRISDEDGEAKFVDICSHPSEGLGAVWSLEQTPYAAGIGIFLALYTSAEFLTASVLARLLQTSEPEALAILEKINGYAPRLSRIESFIEERGADNVGFYKKFVADMRWFNSERNKYAHAHFAVGQETGKCYRALGATDGRKETKWELFPIERLAADILRSRKIIGWIWNEMREQDEKLKSAGS